MPRSRVQYVEPPAAVINCIAATYSDLKDKDPGAYAWFLLGAFVGLRNNEVRVSQWKTKTTRSRDVEIPGAIIAELHALRGVTIDGIKADPVYLVQGHHKTERDNRALRRLNAWPRAA